MRCKGLRRSADPIALSDVKLSVTSLLVVKSILAIKRIVYPVRPSRDGGTRVQACPLGIRRSASHPAVSSRCVQLELASTTIRDVDQFGDVAPNRLRRPYERPLEMPLAELKRRSRMV